MNNRLKKQSGFTLLETLIALVITVGAALILSNSWSGNFLRVRKTALYNNVAILLQRKITEMESKYQGVKLENIKEEEGDFGDSFPQYRWTFSTQPFVMPDLTPVLTNKNSGGTDQMLITMISKMQEMIGKAILEGTVTVFVKSKDKEVPFSVTTYFVDYDSDVEIKQ
jgi:prepilin-type N-terminal cleavage/methylation domain-containing protein